MLQSIVSISKNVTLWSGPPYTTCKVTVLIRGLLPWFFTVVVIVRFVGYFSVIDVNQSNVIYSIPQLDVVVVYLSEIYLFVWTFAIFTDSNKSKKGLFHHTDLSCLE